MATEIPVWISIAALAVSLASFGLSAYVARTNLRVTKTQKRMELLTKLCEVNIQYSELNRRYATLCKYYPSLPADLLDKLLMFKEHEKLTDGFYDFVARNDINATEAEVWLHHIESMQLNIAFHNRNLERWEKGYPKRENQGAQPIVPPDLAHKAAQGR